MRRERNDVLEIFHCNIKLKILHNKEAYLLNEVPKDIEAISDANGLNEIAIKHTVELKRNLISEYGDFFLSFWKVPHRTCL